MRRLLVTLGAGLFLSGLSMALVAGPATASPPSGDAQTVTWTGNGTTDGQCDNLHEGLTGVPSGEQGWLFILTQPFAGGPWTLTATFAQTGTTTTSGTQEGNGSVHFVVDTAIGDTLQSASATNGTANSVLTVSGCTVNGQSEGTTTTTTSTPTTTTTSAATTTTTAGTTTTTPATTIPVVTNGGGGNSGGTIPTTGSPVSGVTSVHTGLAFAGSLPYVLMVLGFGIVLVGLGVGTRRRVIS